MRPEITYSGHHFQLPKEFLRDVMRLENRRSALAVATAWAGIITLWVLMRSFVPRELFWVAYVPAIFFIAGRQGALLQLLHEGAHGLLHTDKRTNRRLAKWLCALPVGVFADGYISGHLRHHAYTNTPKDPASDREKYRETDFRSPWLYFLFLKDLSGWTALSIFFAYKDSEEAGTRAEEPPSKWGSLAQLCSVQLVVLGAGFQFDIADYVLLWLVPAISPHMFLMRIRGIAEHGLASQLGRTINVPSQGTFHTRSFLTPANHYAFAPLVWIEKVLIGSFYVHYHHEHHLFPTVPFYHLPAVHQRIRFQVQTENPDVYAAGYFAAAMRSVLSPSRASIPTSVEA